jgi:hypothetical protein
MQKMFFIVVVLAMDRWVALCDTPHKERTGDGL